ncbi:phage holin family protein [Yimella sp. cx-573]|nr:phage holin family protein [Yimella sp. cx-573]
MKNFLIRLVVNAIALWAAAGLISGIHLAEGAADNSAKIRTILLVALVFGVINALLKPIATFFSFPVIIVTLGLFMIIVNAAMLQLTSWFAGKLDLAFHVDHFFWDAVLGACVIAVVGMIANMVLPEKHEV